MSDIIPDAAVQLAESFEGFSATPYRDPVGVWTIGYGATRDIYGKPVTASTPPVDKHMADRMMRRDLLHALRTVENDVQVELTDHERAALTDFVFNLGSGNFESSTLLKKLNAGDHEGAAEQLLRWNRAGGKVLAGLVRRRQAEREEFQKT